MFYRGMQVGVPIHLDRRPYSAFLTTWGRAPDARWGCCRFMVSLAVEHGDNQLPVAAWLPAASISQPGWAGDAKALPRTQLSHDRTTWPPPDGWPSWYAGAWAAGDLTLPVGMEIMTGPGWRRRKRRGV